MIIGSTYTMSIFDSFFDLIDNVITYVGNGIDNFFNSFGNTLDNFGNALDNAANSFDNALDIVATNLENAVDIAANNFGNALDNAANSFDNALDIAATNLENAVDITANNFGNALDNAADNFDTLLNNITKTLQNKSIIYNLDFMKPDQIEIEFNNKENSPELKALIYAHQIKTLLNELFSIFWPLYQQDKTIYSPLSEAPIEVLMRIFSRKYSILTPEALNENLNLAFGAMNTMAKNILPSPPPKPVIFSTNDSVPELENSTDACSELKTQKHLGL